MSSNIVCIVTGVAISYNHVYLSLSYQGPLGYDLWMPLHLKRRTFSTPQRKCQADASLLSMTTFMLLNRPYTTSMVCVEVACDSSVASRSNLWSTASIPFSPNNFFPNFSASC